MAIAKTEPLKASQKSARDAFVFSFFASGMRYGDLAKLKRINISNGVLRYNMTKTRHPMEVRLPAPALEIASRQPDGPFLFPFLKQGDDRDAGRIRRRISLANAMVNFEIKKVAERAEISEPGSVTVHVSRHSYANMARGNLVSRSLGHQSLTITEAYLGSLGRDDRDRTHSEVWGDDRGLWALSGTSLAAAGIHTIME